MSQTNVVLEMHTIVKTTSFRSDQCSTLISPESGNTFARFLQANGDTVSHSDEPDRSVSKQDLAIQARLADKFGLVNCWQTANPNQPLPQTLRWTKDRTIPFHCDGLFVPKSWKDRLESCVVLSGDDWNRLSDHNPVIAQLR